MQKRQVESILKKWLINRSDLNLAEIDSIAAEIINIDVKDISQGLLDGFEDFWRVYPKERAGSKQKSMKKFVKIVQDKKATVEELIAGVTKYSKSEEVAKGFAKGCEAWLSDDRWKCEYKPKITPFYGREKSNVSGSVVW